MTAESPFRPGPPFEIRPNETFTVSFSLPDDARCIVGMGPKLDDPARCVRSRVPGQLLCAECAASYGWNLPSETG